MSIVKLSKPFNAEGKIYTEFNLDYDNVTGGVMRRAEKIARKQYGLSDMYLPMSTTYRMIFVSQMLKIPVEVLETLPLTDCLAVTDDVLVFLGGAPSDDMTETEPATTIPSIETPEMTS